MTAPRSMLGQEIVSASADGTGNCPVHAIRCNEYLELAELDDRIIEYSKELQRLKTERLRVKEKYNLRHDTVIRFLPVEITARLFKFCLPPFPTTLNDFREFRQHPWNIPPTQLVLGAVCRTWRQILWSSPSFWNQLFVEVLPSIPVRRARLIKEWLERSGEMPLILCLDSAKALRQNISNSDIDTKFSRDLITVVSPHLHRCRILELGTCLSFVKKFPFKISLKSIEGLIINPLPVRAPPFIKWSPWLSIGPYPLPSPKFLWTSHYKIDINWSRLTEYVGPRLTTEEGLALLRRCPQLRVFKCSFAVEFEHFIQNDATRHSELRCLHLNEHPLKTLDYLDLPALEELALAVGDAFAAGDSEDQQVHIRSLVQRSGCSLKTLVIHGGINLDDSAVVTLRLLPTLEHVEWGNLSTRTFQTELQRTAFWDKSHPTTFLPNLHTLVCHLSFNPASFSNWDIFHSIVPLQPPHAHMIRRPLSKIFFRIRLNVSAGLSWETSVDAWHLAAILEIVDSEYIQDFRIEATDGTDILSAWKQQHREGKLQTTKT